MSDSQPEASAGTPETEVDPLVNNGLGSPSCRAGLGEELGAVARHDCETSGFAAAAAPTGDYGIDVHIDTGVLGLSSGGLLSTVQDLVVSPLWMALVWIAHAVIVMLEWGFSIDLLDGSMSELGPGLGRAQASLTTPWLPLALAVAGVLAAYHGLLRRRVAHTLGELLLMGAMLVGGMWMILDPAGTVGALGRSANEAGLGTLAVAAQGSPASPGRALETSMGAVFRAAIEGPWCYLEFGDVSWCRDPGRLDAGLRAAGLKIAAQETQSARTSQLHSARLLRSAQTNGALFLALPANGPARNSINDQGSLLRAICRSEDATSCSGPAAMEAQFRTASGTWARVGGLLLIAGGLLGMAMLLGYIALRLLMAAILSLFYLLLAPGVVLAPAFGEAGRSLFRGWLSRLLGAVVSKLLFAFLLGVVLAVTGVLGSLAKLGWWTQWLLMSAFWWVVFIKRHQLLIGAGGQATQRLHFHQRSFARRLVEKVETQHRLARVSRSLKGGSKPSPEPTQKENSADRTSPGSAAEEPDRQALALVQSARGGLAPGSRGVDWGDGGAPGALRAQAQRIEKARAEALARGDGRRAARLAIRATRVRTEIDRHARPAKQRRGDRGTLRESAALLDRQAKLPPAGRPDRSGSRRDYVAMAALAGYTREEFERLDPKRRRAARLEIDRELAMRRQRLIVPPAAEKASEARATESSIAPARRTRRPSAPSPRGPGSGSPMPPESDVMRDARAVAEGRKRRLGFDQE